MILLNGLASDDISISDRGLQYGDGCFSTLLLESGVVAAWPLHEARLRDNASRLGITDIDWPSVASWVQDAAKSTESTDKAVLKVIITRGAGGRGYSPEGCNAPNVIVSTHAYPAHYEAWREKGIAMVLLEQPLGISPLAGIKHLNRLEQVMLKREVDSSGMDDGVACDMSGNLVETSASNLFWRIGKMIYTPDLQRAGVAGTMRTQVIAAAKALGFDVQEVLSSPDALFRAEEVFITNAVMGVMPVRCVETTNYSAFDACRAITLRLNA
ncbi:aminodeoxychorismate lyase [Enterovibrio norvegicus]|uniref:aminodeoxychorismate lyase n=1 Tax=Enterovibrio norvegicus TaxID=188144 RepID=UPI0002F3D3AF|nr:aminodeoxychorismate lyase [Enterovibrio norvegicus]OEF64462.1 aminodeoxychorismate lyase [Enterovibrio norvegicus]